MSMAAQIVQYCYTATYSLPSLQEANSVPKLARKYGHAMQISNNLFNLYLEIHSIKVFERRSICFTRTNFRAS